MPRKKTINERRLTRRQVQELIASGAKPRPDLAATFEQTFSTGQNDQPLVYELDGERYLFVFDAANPGLGGKGDIYSADSFHRFVRWTARVSEDNEHGRGSSVAHWAYYSALKDRLIPNVGTLIDQLRSRIGRTPEDLDLSYRSLDFVSEYVERIGVERTQQEIYDQLVAYVGEVLRRRIHGRWQLNGNDRQPYPYLVAARHGSVMPINVVWDQLSGLEPVGLRAAAANEVRGTRKPPNFATESESTVRASPPKGLLAAVPAAAYEVRQRYADGSAWVVVFKREVEIGGIACQDEGWFNRKGDPIGITLAREQSLGGRRFSAGSFGRYLMRQGDGRLSDVRLGEDQEVDGLPCRRGTLVMFHANQRVSYLHLASDRDIDGIPCASGDLEVSFHKNGRVSVATLAREHMLIGRTFPRRTWVSFDEKGHLDSASLAQDWEIDGIRYERGTLLRFDRDGQVVHVHRT